MKQQGPFFLLVTPVLGLVVFSEARQLAGSMDKYKAQKITLFHGCQCSHVKHTPWYCGSNASASSSRDCRTIRGNTEAQLAMAMQDICTAQLGGFLLAHGVVPVSLAFLHIRFLETRLL